MFGTLTVSVVTAVLLLLCMNVTASGQQCDSKGCSIKQLSKLFEEALVNSSDALWKLQQIYFNPSSSQNPSLVYLTVVVTINDIIIDQCNYDNNTYGCFCAFDKCSQYYGDDNCNNGQWVFSPYNKLQPFPIESSWSNLERLVTSSMISYVFYIFDPTFLSIMKALSSSVERRNMQENFADIKVHINTTLLNNPCWDDAISALGMVLMWVSLIILVVMYVYGVIISVRRKFVFFLSCYSACNTQCLGLIPRPIPSFSTLPHCN